MAVNRPWFGLMCAICFSRLAIDQCAEDVDGRKWDICKGECAKQAGIKEKL